MPGISDIPFGAARQVVDGVRSSSVARRTCVRIAVEVEEGSPSELVLALRRAFVPQTSTGLVHVAAFGPNGVVRVNPDCDAAVVVSGQSGASRSAARAFASAGVPCALVVETSAGISEGDLASGIEVLSATSADVLLDKLSTWLATVTKADIALASNFEFTRRAVIDRCIRSRSAQNALVGLLPFGSGADLPILCANELLMGLDVAASNGHAASPSRLVEAGWVIGSSYVSREVARRVSRSLPGLGPLVRAAVAYGATLAIGKAIELRFEVPNAWNHRK